MGLFGLGYEVYFILSEIVKWFFREIHFRKALRFLYFLFVMMRL